MFAKTLKMGLRLETLPSEKFVKPERKIRQVSWCPGIDLILAASLGCVFSLVGFQGISWPRKETRVFRNEDKQHFIKIPRLKFCLFSHSATA